LLGPKPPSLDRHRPDTYIPSPSQSRDCGATVRTANAIIQASGGRMYARDMRAAATHFSPCKRIARSGFFFLLFFHKGNDWGRDAPPPIAEREGGLVSHILVRLHPPAFEKFHALPLDIEEEERVLLCWFPLGLFPQRTLCEPFPRSSASLAYATSSHGMLSLSPPSPPRPPRLPSSSPLHALLRRSLRCLSCWISPRYSRLVSDVGSRWCQILRLP